MPPKGGIQTLPFGGVVGGVQKKLAHHRCRKIKSEIMILKI